MTQWSKVDRRVFLKILATGTGLGLGIGWSVLADETAANKKEKPTALNAWLSIDNDNSITVFIPRTDMGQGIASALAMIVAEELEADWEKVQIEWAPLDDVYGNQMTGASTSVQELWEPMRRAGAVAKEMLLEAAANQWQVSKADCKAKKSVIKTASHPPALYGDLAQAASLLTIPTSVELKSADEYTLLGRSVTRLDIREKTLAETQYGIDIKLPGLQTALIVHCPNRGMGYKSYNDKKTLKIVGVNAVYPVRPYRRKPPRLVNKAHALAIVAENFWAAQKGLEQLEVEWEDNSYPDFSSDLLLNKYRHWAKTGKGDTVFKKGNMDAGKKLAKTHREALYEVPFLAHATMCPMSCVVQLKRHQCDVWVPTQAPERVRDAAQAITGLAPNNIHIHKTYMGGGFGRGLYADYASEAIQIAQQTQRPVKLIWTREEDMKNDFYRPAVISYVRAGLDGSGYPVYWDHRVSGIGSWIQLAKGLDTIPYAIANKQAELIWEYHGTTSPRITGAFRGVSHSQNAFFMESFLNELAHVAGKDPYQYRYHLLTHAPRYQKVLEVAAKKAKWGSKQPSGIFQGIALHATEGGIVAQVAEISIRPDKTIKIHRIVCALDCGFVVHPDTVKGQIEGGIIHGLSAALYGEINIHKGRVQQSNFHDYPVMRMNETPKIEVHIIASSEQPGGVGEAGLPPLAPAIINAIYAATGQTIRKLPIRLI